MLRRTIAVLIVVFACACGKSTGPTNDNNPPPGIGGTGGGAPCTGLATVTYGGKTYNTVQIDSQCWLKENLDIGVMIPVTQNQTNNGTVEKYCYNNDAAQCATYGGLYQWNEMMAYTQPKGSQGICPSGFHIPTYTEFQILATTYPSNRANAVKAIGQGTGAGAGTNTTGFSALLAGSYDVGHGFGNQGVRTFMWTSAEYYVGVRPNIYLEHNNDIFGFANAAEAEALSVRCIKG